MAIVVYSGCGVKRVKARARAGDMDSFDEFVAAESAQLASSNPAGQQILKCKEIADGTLSSSLLFSFVHDRSSILFGLPVVLVNDKPSVADFERYPTLPPVSCHCRSVHSNTLFTSSEISTPGGSNGPKEHKISLRHSFLLFHHQFCPLHDEL